MAGKVGGGMGRLLGLGFLFGAKDDGAVKVTEDLSEGFDDVADAVDRTAKRTGGLLKFGNAVGALNFLQVGKLADAMEGLADKAGMGPGAAANSIESWGVQFGKTYKMATAGLGQFTDDVGKYKSAISGTAFGLEVDAGGLTKSVALLARTGNAIEDFGLDVRTIGGSMQAGILEGEELADMLTGLARGYDLGAKGAGRLLDKSVAIGEQFGFGADAARGLREAIKAADPVLAKFGNLKVEDVTESMIRLAAATTSRIGGTFQDNMQGAVQVFNELAGAREEMGKLIVGLGGSFPELAKEIGISTGDIGASMDMIMSDPLTFAKHMRVLMSQLGKDDRRRIDLADSITAMGSGFKFLVQGGEESAAVLEAASKPIKNVEGAFSRLSKKSSGVARTFAESMDLMKERYELQWRKIAGVTNEADRKVMKRQRAAFDRVSEAIRDQIKKGGPLGLFAETWFRLQRYGPIQTSLDLLDKLSKRGGVLGNLADKASLVVPLFEGFGDVLVDLGPAIIGTMVAIGPITKGIESLWGVLTLANPTMLVMAGAGLLIWKNWDKIYPVLEGIWKIVDAVLPKAFDAFRAEAEMVWRSVSRAAEEVWKDYFIPFGKWLSDRLPDMFGVATSAAIIGIHMMIEGAKILGTAFKVAFDVAQKGAQMMLAMNPISLLLKSLQKLSEWAGLDSVADGLSTITDIIPDVGQSFDELQTSMKEGWAKLGTVTENAVDNMLAAGTRAAESGEKVRRATMSAQHGAPLMAEPVSTRSHARSRRRPQRRTADRRRAAERQEAVVEAVQATAVVRGGPDPLAGFLKETELSRKGEEQMTRAIEKGVTAAERKRRLDPRRAGVGGMEQES